MPLTRNQIIIIGAALVFILAVIFIFLGILPGRKDGTGGANQVQLTSVGTENREAFQTFIESYQKLRSNVKIIYTQLPEQNYEQTLINLLASGNAPDIFMFKNSWLTKHGEKVIPAPPNQISLAGVRDLYPQVIEQNFVDQGFVYALPLYIDTLALLYNRDIFDANSIALPPKTWQEFLGIVPRLTKVNTLGQITQSAAAVGGSGKSVNRASDILNLLMLQFDNPQISDFQIRFNNQGLDALNFYLQFANPASPYYTWNDALTFSTDLFSQGGVSSLLDYGEAIPKIKEKNPFISLSISAFPQFAGRQPINFSRYQGLAVSRQSKNSAWAWDFIVNTSTNQSLMDNFVRTYHPYQSPALLTLISKYINDSDIGVFAKQALTARSWREPNPEKVEEIFSEAVQSVLSGRLDSRQALSLIENEVNKSQ